MQTLSVVILTKNAATTIQSVIQSAKLVSSDIIIMDSGSTDDTAAIALQNNVRFCTTDWLGYGATRNKGAQLAYNDFILNLDADEVITPQLAQKINNIILESTAVYGFKRVNFLGNKRVNFGAWWHDIVFRIYNKNHTQWNQDEVHETLINKGLHKIIIAGALNHYTSPDIETYNKKMENYARLSAVKYLHDNKKLKITHYFSPYFNFIKNYFLELGFLDGKAGFQLSKAHYIYTLKKYSYYHQLKNKKYQNSNCLIN